MKRFHVLALLALAGCLAEVESTDKATIYITIDDESPIPRLTHNPYPDDAGPEAGTGGR